MQIRAKLAPIIKSLNGCLKHYEQFNDSYRDQLRRMNKYDPSAPFGNDFSATFSVTTNDHGEDTLACAKDLESGAALPPANAQLDSAARATSAALRAMIVPGTQLDTYLEQKGFLDDHFAKGRTLAATVTPLLNTTLTSTFNLHAAVSQVNDVIRQHELEAIDKREGHSLSWHVHLTLIAARATEQQIRVLNREGKMSADSVQAAVEPFQTAMQGTRDYLTQHPDEAQKAQSDKGLWYFEEKPLTLELNAARELREFLKTPDALPSAEYHLRDIGQHVKEVTDDFNSVIDQYNFAVQNGFA